MVDGYCTLKGMCLSFGKVPNVSHLQVVDLVLAVFIDSRDAEFPLVNVAPFSLNVDQLQIYDHTLVHTHYTMPMKFPQSPPFEMQLSGSNVSARRKIGHDLFPHPPSWENSCLGVGEAPLEVWDHSVVGTLSAGVL